jgi:hypothetical protein
VAVDVEVTGCSQSMNWRTLQGSKGHLLQVEADRRRAKRDALGQASPVLGERRDGMASEPRR